MNFWLGLFCEMRTWLLELGADIVTPFIEERNSSVCAQYTIQVNNRIRVQEKLKEKGIFLVYSPKREDPGNPEFYTEKIPKVCGEYSHAGICTTCSC